MIVRVKFDFRKFDYKFKHFELWGFVTYVLIAHGTTALVTGFMRVYVLYH